MDVAGELDRLRGEITGCDVVVLADLSTDMVLASSADIPPSQEQLDELTAAASAIVTGPIGEGASLLLEGDPPRPDLAVVNSRGRLSVFVAAADERSEALLMSTATDADVARIMDCAQAVLADILADK